MAVQPDAKAHVKLIEWSYRGRLPPHNKPGDANMPPPDGYTLKTTITNGSKEIQVDILTRLTDGATIIVPRGTTPADPRSVSANTMLPDMAQLQGTPLELVMAVIGGASGKIEIVGHSQGGAHAFAIANAAVRSNEALKERLSVTTYNSAPMGQYSSEIEARIGALTTNYRSVWSNAGLDPSGYRYGDLISMLGAMPGKTYEVAVQPSSSEASWLELHNPGLIADLSGAWNLRDITQIARSTTTSPVLVGASLYAVSGFGDPSEQSLVEAIGRISLGVSGILLAREALNLTSPGEFDPRVAALLRNMRFSAAHDGVNDLKDQLTTALVEVVGGEAFGRYKTLSAAAALKYIGHALLYGGAAAENIEQIVMDAEVFGLRVGAMAELVRGNISNVTIDFAKGVGAVASPARVVFHLADRVTRFDIVDGIVQSVRDTPLFFNSTFPTYGQAADFLAKQAGGFLDGLKQLFNPADPLLTRWASRPDQLYKIPEGYILRKSEAVDETGMRHVWLEPKSAPGFIVPFLVSRQEHASGGDMHPVVIHHMTDKGLVVLVIPPRQVIGTDGVTTTTPGRNLVLRTNNPELTANAIVDLVKAGEAGNPFDFSRYSVEGLLDKLLATEFALDATGAALTPDEAEALIQAKDREAEIASFRPNPLAPLVNLDTSNLLSAFGSVLGSRLSDDPLKQAVGSAALSTLFGDIGEALERLGAPGDGVAGASLPGIIGDQFSGDFLRSLKGEGVSAVSSWLVSNVIDALDVEGWAAEVGTSVGSKVISQIISNLTGPQVWATANNEILRFGANGQVVASGGQVGTAGQAGLVTPEGAKLVSRPWNLDITQTAGAAFASFVGGKLADEIKTFDSAYGQIGAAVGQAYGSMNATAYLAMAGVNPLTLAVAAIAVAAWKLLGGFVGSMFGASKSYASVVWDERTGLFGVSEARTVRGGTREGAESLAGTVSGFLNSMVAATGATVGGLDYVEQEFGMRNKAYAYWSDNAYRSRNPEDVLARGYYDGLKQVEGHLIGGDAFAKRALVANLAQQQRSTFEAEAVLGDLTVASDYAFYLKNAATIEAAIVDNPDSAFTAGWIVTLARAEELGLDRRGATDWLGGWNAFLDSAADGKLGGAAWSIANLDLHIDAATNERTFVFERASGAVAGVIGDTVDSASKTIIRGGQGADVITLVGDRLSAGAGLTIQAGREAAVAAVTAEARVGKVALIDAGGGDDIVRGGDLGNDLIGGAGNDVLAGGKLDDWLFGGEGHDVLFAGNASDLGFLSGDAAGEAAATGIDGGNGNYLNGGAGDDRLYGSRGSDWLQGGAGNDRLVGGAGGDVLDGGAGDDRAADGGAGLLGGAGSDQYVFGFGYGRDVAFDDSDPAGVPAEGDALARRMAAIAAGTTARAWQGGFYEEDGSVRGGEDAITLAQGVSLGNILMRRSGTEAAPGQDLVIELVRRDASGSAVATGDILTVKNWFEMANRIEWLRFADGEEIRIGDIVSFKVGTDAADVVLGTYGSDFLYGGGGDDEIRGLAGNDFGSGGAGNDFVAGDGDEDWVSGGSGDDIVIGGAGHDTVFGDDGADQVFGGDGSDILAGGRGDDTVVGGAGDDVIRYSRGDGRDVVLDDLVDNWDQVYVNGAYVNGYQLQANGTVLKDGAIWFDGSKWIGGQFDWNDETKVLRRHKGAVNGVLAQDSGHDSLEFGVGIDIQDLVFRRLGNDLVVGVTDENASQEFAGISDSLQIRDWYTAGQTIEQFVFASTGIHDVSGIALGGGTDSNDVLTGTAGSDWMTGGAGDDRLEGGGGADILGGGGGHDDLSGGAGDDVLYGGADDDVLDGGAGADFLAGGAGFDIASYESDTAATGAGVSVFLDAGMQTAFATGHARGDRLSGIEGLKGTGRDDRLGGSGGQDWLAGGRGDDRLSGGLGDDAYFYERGDGDDVITEGGFVMAEVLSDTGALTSRFETTWTALGQVTDQTGVWHQYQLVIKDKVTGAEIYRSRSGADFRYAGPQPMLPPSASWPFAEGQWATGFGRTGNGLQVSGQIGVAGAGGDDSLSLGQGISLSDLSFVQDGAALTVHVRDGGSIRLVGQTGSDTAVETLAFADGLSVDLGALRGAGQTATGETDLLVGGSGAEVLSGLGGDDVLSGSGGADALLGGDGNDVLEGGAGADRLDGGAGEDTIRYVSSTAGVSIDLTTLSAGGGDAAGDVLVAEAGVATVEHITGSQSHGDMLRGDHRANRIQGLGGDDQIFGEAGDDVIDGGDGNDVLEGGEGADALSGGNGADIVRGDAGADLLFGGAGDDELWGGAGDDHLSGDAGADQIHGGDGRDVLDGGAGDDHLYGGLDDDILSGGAGGDQLFGGQGSDRLMGGAGDDRLEGNAGDDEYVFGAQDGQDTVLDAEGRNTLVFTGLDSSSLWLTRSGDHLVVAAIGGDTRVTIQNYFVAGGTSLQAIRSDSGWLFPDSIHALAMEMTARSVSTPAIIPADLKSKADQAWRSTGQAAPQVSNQQWTMVEDGVLQGAVAAIDLDNDIVRHTLLEQPTSGAVVLDPMTGAWTYRPDVDATGLDYFVIQVEDAAGHKIQQRVDVSVTPVNDAPTIIVPATALSVMELAADAQVIGQLGHQDAEGHAVVFSLVDDAGGRFLITADGTIKVANGAALDFEGATSHVIRVRATDAGGLSTDATIEIAVENANERPTTPVVVSQAVMQVGENTAMAGTVIAQLGATDPDGTVPVFQLVGNDGGLFEIVDGQLRFRQGAVIDFEALKGSGVVSDFDSDGTADVRLTATVVASDGSLTSDPRQVFIHVEDVNEAPSEVIFSPVVGAVQERDRAEEGAEKPAILLGTLSALDPDTSGTDFSNIVYTVADSRLEIVNGDQLRLKAGASFDYEAGSTVSVVVTATDRGGEGLSRSVTVLLQVTDADDYLYGGANDDVLEGQAGRDLIYGGSGDDVLNGYAGDDFLEGGDGADRLYGGEGVDRLVGGLGDDLLDGGEGDDTLLGGDGVDHLSGGDGDDALQGEAGDDVLVGGGGKDSLFGGDGNDRLEGNMGDDSLFGGAGEDHLVGGAGADLLDGGSGFDTASYESATSGVTVGLATGGSRGAAAGDVLVSIERLVGSAFDDVLAGGSGDDVLEGGAGDDILHGGEGNDVLLGGAGEDILYAENGGDTLDGGSGDDLLVGGLGSDTYLIDINSGSDTIREFDPSGTDVDVIGYRDIDRARLWFERSGDDLVVSVVGSTVTTRIESWYVGTSETDRSNYKIDFFLAGQHFSKTIDAEGLVELMAGYAKPTSTAAFDSLHADLAFQNRWVNYWDDNGAPTVAPVATQTIGEDGTLTIQITVTDDITPVTGMTISAQAVKANDFNVADESLVGAPVIGAPDATGRRTLTVVAKPNASGQVGIKVLAVDPGGLVTEHVFLLNITPSADAPVISQARALATTLDSGSLALDIQAALVDQDGSETLSIRIGNIPTGLSLNKGVDLGGGVWAVTPAQLTGLALVGPANWSADLTGASALTVTAVSTETATGQTAQTSQTLAFAINARPSDIMAGALTVTESVAGGAVVAGTVVGSFTRVDPDNDAATYSLVDNAGGRFAISTAGVLTVANGALLNHEAATSHSVTVRVTDSGGLTRDEVFVVSVTNVNEAPTTPGANQAVALVNENGAVANTVVATLSASDPDGTAPSFVLTSNPSGLFVISGSQLRFASSASLDFEALRAAGYTLVDSNGDGRQEVELVVKVRATDGALNSPEQSLTVRVQDVNEAPASISPDRALTVAENSGNGLIVANFSATDPDVGDGRTFSLVNNAGGRFSLSSAGTLTVANGALLDREAAASHTITVRVTDSAGLTRDQVFSVGVANVNEAPTRPTATVPAIMSENAALAGTTAATLSATDPDGTAPAYVLQSDPLGWFVMSGARLNFRTGLNFNYEALEGLAGVSITDADNDGQREVSYTVTVASTDGSLTSPSQSVTVRIEDVNEAFTLGGLSTGYLSEAAPGAGQTLVGTVTVSDPDVHAINRNHVFSLTGADAWAFSINNAGQVYLQAGLNYEAKSQYNFTVVARDAGGVGFISTQNVVVNVANEPEPPTLTYSGGGDSNVKLIGADPDGGGVTYHVVSAQKHTFIIIANSLVETRIEDVGTGGFISNGNVIRSRGELYPPGSLDHPAMVVDIRYKIQVVARDSSGMQSSVLTFWTAASSVWLAPIVIDLDGDGVEVVSLHESGVAFDMNADGRVERTGWVGADDGLLVLDRNGDGIINDGSEIAFDTDLDGARTDLEGLRGYDTNGDGLLTAADEKWAAFQIWQDKNQNGVSDAGELMSLDAAGVSYLNLTLEQVNPSQPQGGNHIHGTASTGWLDGRVTQLGDVLLAYEVGVVSENNPFGPAGYTAPVVLDLNGGGVELISRAASSVSFDMDGDGTLNRTGWVGAGDGMLALDRNGDGAITSGQELSFVGDVAGALTDLEGLRGFDANADGQLDAGDARFAEFLVWRDKNQDGISQASELTGLEALGVTAISLTSEARAVSASQMENKVFGATVYSTADGARHEALDVALAFDVPDKGEATVRLPTNERVVREDILPVAGAEVGYENSERLRAPDGRGGLHLERTFNDGADLGSQLNERSSIGQNAGVDRRARGSGKSTAQRMRAAMGGGVEPRRGEAHPANDRRPASSFTPSATPPRLGPSADLSPLTVDVAAPVSDKAGPISSPAGRRSSALHSSLDLGARMRLQMVDAMAGFGAKPFMDGQGARPGRSREAVALLTSLPDVRIGS
jgi:Ca2+-binding RTX toxin-like protein